MKLGDKFKIPEELCGHKGRVVGMSADGKSIYVKCEHEHLINPLTQKPYGNTKVWKDGSFDLIPIKKKDIVYVIDNP